LVDSVATDPSFPIAPQRVGAAELPPIGDDSRIMVVGDDAVSTRARMRRSRIGRLNPRCVIATPSPGCFYEVVRFRGNTFGTAGKATMTLKSFLLTLGIFCGGYISNTLLDEAVDAAEKYFRVQTSTYKTDPNGYIICSPEKPKITNAELRPLTLNASDE
jgi:hypothetical protein